MEKISKLTALILSLFVIFSLLTACGTTITTKPTGRNLLIGDWELDAAIGGMKLHMKFTFNDDGTTKASFSESDYNTLIEAFAIQQANNGMFTQEEVVEMIKSQMPYESLAEQFDKSVGTWELNGDTLTFSIGPDSEPLTAQTKLSAGETTFTAVSDGEEWVFTKTK